MSFARPAWRRGVWAVGYGLLALGLVLAVESAGRGEMPVKSPSQLTTSSGGILTLTAARPVTRWSVLAEGRPLLASASSAQGWSGPLPAGAVSLLIDTEAEPGPQALRLEVPGRLDRTVWGDGTVVESLVLPAPKL